MDGIFVMEAQGRAICVISLVLWVVFLQHGGSFGWHFCHGGRQSSGWVLSLDHGFVQPSSSISALDGIFGMVTALDGIFGMEAVRDQVGYSYALNGSIWVHLDLVRP